jgi:hypothetical protein
MRRASVAAFAVVLLGLVLAGCQKQAAPKDADFGGAAFADHAFRGKLYYLKADTPRLPDFGSMIPVATVYAKKLDVPTQSFSLGFPGVTERTTWFAIDYLGAFTVARAGRYGFRLLSDDGSKLYIDGKLVVDNDGVHATGSASGEADLAAGPHRIEVQYFQGPPVEVALQLFCTKPGGGAAAEAIFPGCGLDLARTPGDSWLIWAIALLLLLAFLAWVFRDRWRKPKAAAG